MRMACSDTIPGRRVQLTLSFRGHFIMITVIEKLNNRVMNTKGRYMMSLNSQSALPIVYVSVETRRQIRIPGHW